MVAPFTKGMLLGQRFEIIAPLGKGGMATVFRAQDLELDRLVAIKVLAPAMASNDILRRRFLREAENAAVMSHPNIVKVYGAHIHDGAPFIAMEYVDGVTLRDRLKNSFPLKEGLGVLGPVALALSYAHGLGLVHRDLKPENVFCTTRGVPMVGDWGLARSQNDGTGLTATGVLLGTPRYMSPEQIISGGGTAQSDLYSLGIMLFELAAGRTPFLGPDVPTVLRGHIEKAVPNLHNVAPGTPRPLVELINKLLEKEPANRPQSTEEVAEQLRLLAAEMNDELIRPLRASSSDLLAGDQSGLTKTSGGVSRSDTLGATHGDNGTRAGGQASASGGAHSLRATHRNVPSANGGDSFGNADTATRDPLQDISGGRTSELSKGGAKRASARPLKKTKVRKTPEVKNDTDGEGKEGAGKWAFLAVVWLLSLLVTSLLTAHYLKGPQVTLGQGSQSQQSQSQQLQSQQLQSQQSQSQGSQSHGSHQSPTSAQSRQQPFAQLNKRSVDELLEALNRLDYKTFINVLKDADAVRAKLQKRRWLFDNDNPMIADPVYAHCVKEAEQELDALYLEKLRLSPIDMETLRENLPKRLNGRTLGTAAAKEVLRLRYLESQIADNRGPRPAWGYVSRLLGIHSERLRYAKPLDKRIKVLASANLLTELDGPHYRWCWLAEESMIEGYVSGLAVVANPMDVVLQRLKDDPGVYDLLGQYEKLPTPKVFVSKKELILTIDEEKWPPERAAIVVNAKLFSRDHEIIVALNGEVIRLLNGGRLVNAKWTGSRMRPLRLFAPIRPRLLKKGKNELSIVCRRVPGLSDPGAMALARVSLVSY